MADQGHPAAQGQAAQRRTAQGRPPTQRHPEAQGHPAPLAGVRVADFTRVLAGPFATMALGDLGADVVKVESLDGDDTRGWGPPFAEGESAYYLCANRNKRSLALDLSSEPGREVCRRLVAGADVVVHNLRTRSARRLGLDYEQVREVRPDVVHCAISGYGEASERPGYDYILQAVGGLMSITGEPDGPPVKVGVALTDLFTGLYAVVAIQAALAHRARTGEGQAVDLALYDAQLAMLANVASSALVGGGDAPRLGNAHPTIVPYQLFETADGTVVVTVGNDRQFALLCDVLERPDLAQHPDYRTNRDRVAHRDTLVPQLEDLVRRRTTGQVVAALEERGVPVGPVRSVAEALASDLTAERGMVWQVPHPLLGHVPLVGSPLKLGLTPPVARRHPPLLGEHTREVLAELGFGEAEVGSLLRDGVVRG
jgi:crotonobetainyl-CoA:carnitine CoA-transferase CaiB-like acyl-CoA transferase